MWTFRKENVISNKMEEQFVWVFCTPEDPYTFAMIPPAPTKLYIDWWAIGGYLTDILAFVF